MASIAAYREAEGQFWDDTAGARPTERTVRLEHLETDVRVLEHGEGPTLLFLHGGPNAGSTWAPLMPELAGYRCLLVDRPGCGLSTTAEGAPRSVRAFVVQLVDELLGSLDPEPVAIVASSFGSYATLAHACAHPDDAPPSVHFGCPALVPRSKVPLPFFLQMLPGVGWLMAKLAPPPLEQAPKVMRMIGHGASIEAGRITNDLFRWYAALLEHTDTRSNDLALFGRIRPKDNLRDEELASISTPLSFFWGADDPFGGLSVGEALADVIGTEAFEAIDDAGHLPWLDFPEEAGRHVTAFLSAHGIEPR